MSTIALFDAKNRLSELIDRVQAGESFQITRRGKVVASLGAPDGGGQRNAAQDAVDSLRAARHGVSLGKLKSLELIKDGRR